MSAISDRGCVPIGSLVVKPRDRNDSPICVYQNKATHTQAHMYNQHTRGMATTRHKSLVERGGRKALLQSLHTQNKNKKNVR